MPYKIVKYQTGFRVCKAHPELKRSKKSVKHSSKRSSKQSSKRCFSNGPLSYEQAKKQRTAIILSEFRRGTYKH